MKAKVKITGYYDINYHSYLKNFTREEIAKLDRKFFLMHPEFLISLLSDNDGFDIEIIPEA